MGVRQPLFREVKVRSKPHGEQQFRLPCGSEKECTLWLHWSVPVCCVQKGSRAPAHLLPSCSLMHIPVKQEKYECSRYHRSFWSSNSHSPSPMCCLKAKSTEQTRYLPWPDRWSSAATQHFILQNPEGMDTVQWTRRWTEVKKPLMGLHLSTWEILDQQSTQTDT